MTAIPNPRRETFQAQSYTEQMADDRNLGFDFEPEREVFSVSGLNRETRRLIESGLGTVWVEGEISNLARPSSGHMYWSLKDDKAQVRCAMFRQLGRSVNFAAANGLQVLVRGRVSLYEARGDYQIIVDYMEEAGEGLLRRRFEELKARLEAEGLFDASRKLALPALPGRIGVVTSTSGAAIRDVLTSLRRRFPAVEVLIYPSAVQGDGAAESLAKMLRLADRRGDCDVLILTRGGGSLEDLWAFNEEVLARAISEISIPVICGVGHETDFTIADFVADLRAPTPSQAAELAVPDQAEWKARVHRAGVQIARAMQGRFVLAAQRENALTHRLQRAHPGIAMRERAQRLDELEARLGSALERRLTGWSTRVERLQARVRAENPRHRVTAAAVRGEVLRSRLGAALSHRLERAQSRLALATASLRSLGPTATLERGYAIVTDAGSGAIVRDSRQVETGQALNVRVGKGRLGVTVDTKEP